MNKQFLKTLRDLMPEFLKDMAAPLIRDRLIKDDDFRKFYDLLQKREFFSASEIEAYQFDQLKMILNHAYLYVPYYQRLFKKVSFDPTRFSGFEEMEKIPFLTKQIIKDNFNDLISKKPIDKGSYPANTGGSTGEPLKLLLDYSSLYKENAFIYFFRKKLGYAPEHKVATFRGIEFGDKLWKLNPLQNEIIFSPFRISKLTINKYIDRLNQFKPQFLNGYLSSLYFFARLLDENNLRLDIDLKGIFLISENINGTQRRYIEDFFGVKAMTFYGHTERCIIAEEISPGSYRFDPFYGYTELIPLENNISSITGTGFLNYTMPFIRYKTDDICISCDGHYTIRGKRESSIGLFGKNNEYFGQAAFNVHKDIFRNVSQYQFVQNEKGKADFLIVVNKEFKSSELDQMQKEFALKTNGIIEFNIKIVDNLILTPSGKFNMFVQE